MQLKRFGLYLAAPLLGTSYALAGSVSGIVVDDQGKPVAGVHVEVLYQTFNSDQLTGYGESIKAETVSGPNGLYTLDTTYLPRGEYSAHAYQVIVNGDEEVNVDAVGSDPSTFTGSADTIRNFSVGIVEISDDMPYGNAGIVVVNNAIRDYTDLSGTEITLVNIETGATYVKTVRSTGEGLVVTGIPFGAYRASARLSGRSMQIALWGPGESDVFALTVEHNFTMGYSGNQMQVAVKP
ncbi:carboxypeptidase-like regulatory domain-containing protein [Sinorhizobium sp. RAC02]|uniref:carboxypeptidase-like regulatory domain-containing protein n=1 Tax=Sinorhizobium sp. RAC02 TaxID=1842534 RepID=UPI00083CDC6A|nr:carboxypeptidase-like regulatory domain-containing protein [Sinorhizobium sp. RAC02]AOF93097.1 carboxypeptidase regulatory-like domain protein [Sinorhizobium sp. RAC02]